MSQQVLEGAWEEIAERADELFGKRVKLIILDESRQIPANGGADQSQAYGAVAQVMKRPRKVQAGESND